MKVPVKIIYNLWIFPDHVTLPEGLPYVKTLFGRHFQENRFREGTSCSNTTPAAPMLCTGALPVYEPWTK